MSVSFAAWAYVFATTFADGIEFNRDIRPIFSDTCFTCHGPDTANRKTKLRFDNEEGAKIDFGSSRSATSRASSRSGNSDTGHRSM